MKVELTYFKETGKLYASGAFDSKPMPRWEVVRHVRILQAEGALPGLIPGCREFVILITCPEDQNDVPRLIFPKECKPVSPWEAPSAKNEMRSYMAAVSAGLLARWKINRSRWEEAEIHRPVFDILKNQDGATKEIWGAITELAKRLEER